MARVERNFKPVERRVREGRFGFRLKSGFGEGRRDGAIRKTSVISGAQDVVLLGKRVRDERTTVKRQQMRVSVRVLNSVATVKRLEQEHAERQLR